jgi:hypothetical protein
LGVGVEEYLELGASRKWKVRTSHERKKPKSLLLLTCGRWSLLG